MKLLTSVLLLLFSSIICAQELPSKELVNALKAKITTEKNKSKKLQLLDSLTSTVRDHTEFSYDSIARKTIDYALQLDSFNIAAYNASNLIYYHNNILGQPEEGIAIFNKYFDKVKNKISDRNLASLYIDSGDSYSYIGQIDNALSQYDKAKVHGKKAGNKRVTAFAFLYEGYIHLDEGDFTKASQSFQEASEIFTEEKDTFNIIASKNALSILYSSNNFLAEAHAERKEAIALAIKSKSYGQLTSLYVNEASDNKKQGFQEKRIKNLLKAEKATKKSKYFENLNPILLSEIVKGYAENDSLEKAQSYLNQLEKKPVNTEGLYEPNYIDALKIMAMAKQNYAEAEKLGLKHLEILSRTNRILEIKDAQLFLANVYEKLNKPDLAFSHYKIYNKIEDSIQSVQKTRTLAYYQTLYETAKRDKRIKEQDNQILLHEEQNKLKTVIWSTVIIMLLGIFTIIYLWRSRKFSQNKVNLQKVFAQDLIRNIEAERKRISGELHDSVGQNLLLIKNQTLSDSENTRSTVLIDNTIDEVRNISQSLHPFRFEQLGLIDSIKDVIDNFQKNSEIFYSADIDIEILTFSKDKEIFVYRMIQECLNNVEKHSKAKACVVSVKEKPNAYIFEVKDNGVGFNVSEKSELLNSLGMKTLKERAQIINGSLEIISEIGKGTTVVIKVPKG